MHLAKFYIKQKAHSSFIELVDSHTKLILDNAAYLMNISCHNGNLHSLRLLVQMCPSVVTQEAKKYLVCVAGSAGHNDILRFMLLEHENIANIPIILADVGRAIAQSGNTICVETVLDVAARAKVRIKSSLTFNIVLSASLHGAVIGGHVNLIKHLIALGAEKDQLVPLLEEKDTHIRSATYIYQQVKHISGEQQYAGKSLHGILEIAAMNAAERGTSNDEEFLQTLWKAGINNHRTSNDFIDAIAKNPNSKLTNAILANSTLYVRAFITACTEGNFTLVWMLVPLVTETAISHGLNHAQLNNRWLIANYLQERSWKKIEPGLYIRTSI